MAKKLYRSRTNRVIGGVAAGIGHYLDLDPVLVRVLWALLFFLRGTGLLLYILAWIIIPEEPASESGQGSQQGYDAPVGGELDNTDPTAEVPHTLPEAGPVNHENRQERTRKILGGALIVVGVLFFLDELAPRWVDLDIIWPIGLIAVGVIILSRRA